MFVTEQPSESLPTNPSAPSGPEPSQSTASVDWLTADEANELARVGTHKEWAKAKTAVAFQKSQPMVFQALIQAVRNSQCEIVEVDSVNFRIKFLLHLQSAPNSEHTAFAFATGHGSCDVDMSSRDANANGHFDSYYHAIVLETGKYLMFVPEPQPLPLRPRRRRRRDDDDDDYYYSRKGRRARKSRLAYILLALFFGFLGVHNFYVNRTGPGVAQLVVCLVSSVLLCVYVGIVGFVGLFVWNIVEIITVQKDGTGVTME